MKNFLLWLLRWFDNSAYICVQCGRIKRGIGERRWPGWYYTWQGGEHGWLCQHYPIGWWCSRECSDNWRSRHLTGDEVDAGLK